MEQTSATKSIVPPPEKGQQFNRSIGLVSNFALGFTYLSPLTAVYSLFALVFGEVASQYPITGGLYPWARRLWGKKYAWIAAWIYLWALVVTITSIVEYTSTFVASLFHYGDTPIAMLLTSVVLLAIMMGVNMSGTKNLARVARFGFWCEIISVIALDIYLLIFHRSQPFSVVFDAMGALAKDGSYGTAFMSASLMGLFMFFGFEACGNVAEEVQNPGRKIPVAMILSIVFGAISAVISILGYLLSSPDLMNIVNGKIADPIPAILNDALGEKGATLFIVIAVVAMLSCILSLKAALSRLIFSFSRDKMLPGSEWLAKISKHCVPDNAMLPTAYCLLPMVICVWVYFQPDNLSRITAFAVIGIYISFQMVILAALRQRLKGCKPAGEWTLGSWGMLVNVMALAYGIGGIWLLAQPADSTNFIDRWTVLVGLALIVGSGLAYMALARPFGHSDAPENDAIEYADKLKLSREY
ncbi:APC family permease [Cedecea davisae]|uniref:APC family permease n=1 Tax=Cedecea davisae TaxID=158484 RepID=UPI00242CAD14|nr:APC family permease [Cedecea davisae]